MGAVLELEVQTVAALGLRGQNCGVGASMPEGGVGVLCVEGLGSSITSNGSLDSLSNRGGSDKIPFHFRNHRDAFRAWRTADRGQRSVELPLSGPLFTSTFRAHVWYQPF